MKRFYKAEHAGITWTRTTARTYTHAVVAKFDGAAQNAKADADLVANEPTAVRYDTKEYKYETVLATKNMGDSYVNRNGFPDTLKADSIYSQHILETAKALVAKHPTMDTYLAERAAGRKAQRELSRIDHNARDGKWILQGWAGRPDLAAALVSKARSDAWSCYSEAHALPAVELTDKAAIKAAKLAEKGVAA